jgi:adenylate cyclase
MNLRIFVKSYSFLFALNLFSYTTFCQDQRIADSLKIIYQTGGYPDSIELEVLHELSFNEMNDYNLALSFATELILLSTEKGIPIFQYRGYLQKGRITRLKGDLQEAIQLFFRSAEFAEKAGYSEGVGGAYISIADIYSINGSSENAILYYNRAIELLRNTNDSVTLATALLNAGDEYFNSQKYDSALLYFKESGVIFKNVDYLIGTAYNLGNVGMVYAEQDNDALAETNINEAIAILEELQDYYPIAVYLTYMSDIYSNKGEDEKALAYAKRSLELAEQYGLKEQISDANLKLSEIYEAAGDLEQSYLYYKNHIAYRDSVRNIESVQQMADLRTNYEVSQKQIEVDLLNQQKENQQIIVIATVIALFLIGLLAFGLYRRSIFIQRTSKIIEKEKNRSESLLLNILPEETAIELKEKGRVQAKKFESATVLFTDFREFTKLAEAADPEQLIRSVDFYFKEFDEIITRHGLEKIKTIGDAYMCAGGLPSESTTHATDTILAAKEMLAFVDQELHAKNDLIHFEIRIGVHSGQLIAGIVGNKKWQYDIWGDTVNIASRIESKSTSGKINLSESTYLLINDQFPCEYRGEIEIKNHGPVKMYFLS